MIQGTFDSSTGIYTISGKTYKARWYANAQRMSISEMKVILETAYNHEGSKRARGVLVCGEKKWNEIVSFGLKTWYGLAMLHYYAPEVMAGSYPAWAQDFVGQAGLLIHEYADGKIAYLKSEATIPSYFVKYSPPAVEEKPAVISGLPREIEIDLKVGDTPITGKIVLK